MIHRIVKDTGIENGNTYDIEEFGSIHEFVTTIDRREYNPNYKNAYTGIARKRIPDEQDWFGVESYEQARNWLFHGWNEKTGEVVRFMNEAKTTGVRKVVTFHNDLVGFAPIVPLALMGVPQNMIQSTRRVIKTKIIDIIYDMGATCMIESEKMLQAGIRMTKLIVSLENAGYRVRLRGMINFQSYETGKASQMALIGLKDANQPMDINKLMFPLFHTGMFRGIGFDYLERKPNIPYLSGYGRQIGAVMDKDEARAMIRRVVDKTALYMSYYIVNGSEDDKSLYDEVTEVNNK